MKQLNPDLAKCQFCATRFPLKKMGRPQLYCAACRASHLPERWKALETAIDQWASNSPPTARVRELRSHLFRLANNLRAYEQMRDRENNPVWS